MTINKNRASAGVVALLMLVIVLVAGGTGAVPGIPALSQAAANIIVAENASCDVKVAASMAVRSTGFTADQFVIGEENFDLTLPAATEIGGDAFASEPITNSQLLFGFLNNGTDASNETVAAVVKTTGVPEDEVRKNIDRWVGVQYLVPSNWPGNSAYQGGEFVQVSAVRNSTVGDIAWVYVPEAACQVVNENTNPETGVVTDTPDTQKAVADKSGWMRGGCANVQNKPPEPPNPPKPPEPKPCVDPGKPGDGNYVYDPKTCTWRKPGQSFDEQQNGDTGVRQPPQDNSTSGVDTGPTTDGDGNPIPEPSKRPAGPSPQPNSPAPSPNDGGYDGGSDGGNLPGGSTTDDGGTTTGGTDGTSDPEDTGQGGTGNDTDPGVW